MDSVKRNFAILFLILFILGSICIFKGYDIGNYSMDILGWGMYTSEAIFIRMSWIVFGGVVSLLSGYGLIKMMLKYME